jgi:hypothetical protein
MITQALLIQVHKNKQGLQLQKTHSWRNVIFALTI